MNSNSTDDFLIRPAEPSDAKAIIEALKRCYGNSYPNSQMYQVDEVKNLIQSQLMHSVIAISSQGTVAGHCALSYEHPLDQVPEAGKLFVDPEYRGKHLSDMLAKERKKHAQFIGLQGFWAACVTNHPYSQLETIALGGAETGLFINGQPKSVHMDGLQNIDDARHSLIPCYVNIQDKGNFLAHVAPHHAPFFEDLLRHTGIQRKLINQSTLNTSADLSALSMHHSPEGKPSFIKVREIGRDFLRRIESLIEVLRSENHPVIYIDIPLSDPLASQSSIDLESLGFFWGAWLPNYDQNGDVLRLQCLLDPSVNETSIVCARKESEFIRDYVLSEWRRTR
jgi:predicted N-acetyltransferase YhbS